MIKRKYLLKILFIGLVSLFMLMVTADSAKAAVYLTDSTGADLVSGNSYKIMFGWGSTSSKNVYLTGNQFYSTTNPNAGGYYQILRTDKQTGLPIQPGDGFIVKSLKSGQYWNYHSNMVSINVLLGNSPITDTHTITTSDGSTFFAIGNREEKSGDGYFYGLGAGGYGLGYDWNNNIGDKNSWETELFFKP